MEKKQLEVLDSLDDILAPGAVVEVTFPYLRKPVHVKVLDLQSWYRINNDPSKNNVQRVCEVLATCLVDQSTHEPVASIDRWLGIAHHRYMHVVELYKAVETANYGAVADSEDASSVVALGKELPVSETAH
jgi:hypothetical protein